MASDDSRPAAPIVLRIKLRYDDVEAMVARFAANVGKSGLFLPTKSIQPIGAEIKFDLRLSDDTPALVGLGRVKAATPPDPQRPRAPFGMTIELMRVTPQSRALILRMLERRRELGLPEVALPTAADLEAARRLDAVAAARDQPSGPVPVATSATTSASQSGPLPRAPGEPPSHASTTSASQSGPLPRAPGEPPSPASTTSVSQSGPLPRAPAGDVGTARASQSGTQPPPVHAPSEALLTAPRRQTGPMAVAKVLAVAPLAPEPPRRARPAVHEFLERAAEAKPQRAAASTAAASEAAIEEAIDVSAALARARSLAGGGLDAELDALSDAAAAPVELSIEAASAELARQLGGRPVRRGRTHADRASAATDEDSPVRAGAQVAAPEPSAATATDAPHADVATAASDGGHAEAHRADADARHADDAHHDADARHAADAHHAADDAHHAADDAHHAADDAHPAIDDAHHAVDDAHAAVDDAPHAAVDAHHAVDDARHAVDEPLAATDHAAALAADEGAPLHAPPMAFAAAPMAHDDRGLDEAEHTELGGIPAPPPDRDPEPTPDRDPQPTPDRDPEPTPDRDPEPTPDGDPEPAPDRDPEPAPGRHAPPSAPPPTAVDEDDLEISAALDRALGFGPDPEPGEPDVAGRADVAPLAAAADPRALAAEVGPDHPAYAGEPGASLNVSLEEIDDFEILAEADAADEDLLSTHGEQEASGVRDRPTPQRPTPRQASEFDFAAQLDLGDDDPYADAAPSEFATQHVVDGLHAQLAPPVDDAAYEDLEIDRDPLAASAGQALAAFDTPDDPPRTLPIQPIFEPEQTNSYTLASVLTDSVDIDLGPAPPAPTRAPAPTRTPAPTRAAPPTRPPAPSPPARFGDSDDELEQALGALDVDLDDLSIPHAAPRPARSAYETLGATRAIRPTPLPRPVASAPGRTIDPTRRAPQGAPTKPLPGPRRGPAPIATSDDGVEIELDDSDD